jgi:hypothetical protein
VPTEKITEALEAGIRQHQLITAERELLENTLKRQRQACSRKSFR